MLYKQGKQAATVVVPKALFLNEGVLEGLQQIFGEGLRISLKLH